MFISEIFEKAQVGTLLPSSSRLINGVNVPLLILADPPYPLLAWLMKPMCSMVIYQFCVHLAVVEVLEAADNTAMAGVAAGQTSCIWPKICTSLSSWALSSLHIFSSNSISLSVACHQLLALLELRLPLDVLKTFQSPHSVPFPKH